MEDKKPFKSSFVPFDIEASLEEFDAGVPGGEPCHVDGLKDVFAWMPGYVNAWTGWPNDGKGTFFDFLAVLKAKKDGDRFCLMKREDMNSVRKDDGKNKVRPLTYRGKPVKFGNRTKLTGGKIHISANKIYKNLAWTLTGKTWNKDYAERHRCPRMSYEEENAAMEFITSHFFVVDPIDRNYKTMLDEFKFQAEVNGCQHNLIDPWNTVIVSGKETTDIKLSNAFDEIKTATMQTGTTTNIIGHPKSMDEEKYKAGEYKGRYKIINPSLILGGSAWNTKMDGFYSVYRSERHLNPNDTKVEFYNFKQRDAEVVGVGRGMANAINFDPKRKQYFFKGVCPMDGSIEGMGMPSDKLPF